MNINKKEDFSFVHKDHKCIAYLTYDGIVFDGCAICHPKDRDFESKKTGEKIASMRTLEKIYAYLIKKYDIEINTLKMLKNAYLQSGFEKDDYILFLGRLVPEKGLRYLIEAFKQVKTDKKLVKSVIDEDYSSLHNNVPTDFVVKTYSYEDDPKGNRIVDYKITDKNGKVLLDKSSTFEVVNDNKFISTRNNEKYEITVDKHDINVVDMNNPKRQARISIDNQIKGNKEKIMKSLKAMPGEELFMVAQTTKKLVGNKDVLESYYDPSNKEIHSGENLFVILHELGHARDYRDVDGSSDEAYADTVDMAIQEDPEVQKVYDKERKAFNKAFPDTQRDHIDYFINKVTHYGGELGGLGETIAESNALLTTPKTHELLAIRSQYLQQYFPETIAKLSEKLSQEIA